MKSGSDVPVFFNQAVEGLRGLCRRLFDQPDARFGQSFNQFCIRGHATGVAFAKNKYFGIGRKDILDIFDGNPVWKTTGQHWNLFASETCKPDIEI